MGRKGMVELIASARVLKSLIWISRATPNWRGDDKHLRDQRHR